LAEGSDYATEKGKTVDERYKLVCATCDNDTWHIVMASVDTSGEYESAGVCFQHHHQIVKCLGCEAVSFRQQYWDDSGNYEEEGPSIDVYPPRRAGRKLLAKAYYLPSLVQTIYRETHAALVGGHRLLAAVGVRALIEGVCKEKKAGGRNLQQRIDDLVDKRVLTPGGAEVLHKTRFLGNEAAHELTPPPDEVLDAAMEVAEHLLQSVYILPNVAARLPNK
jgi:hypothetical protein